MPRLIETTGLVVRLLEHPGHPDQKVHGHRGGAGAPPGNPEDALIDGRTAAGWPGKVLPAGYLYHGTPARNLDRIREQGLRGQGYRVGDEGPFEEVVFFADANDPRPAIDHSWTDDDVPGARALLRIKDSDSLPKGHMLGTVIKGNVAPDRLELWGADGAWHPLVAKVTEARLVEHPGHGDQKVHGRRGGRNAGPVDLYGRVRLSRDNGDAGINSSWEAKIDGQRVFAKGLDDEEMHNELAAQALLDTYGPLIPHMPLVDHSLRDVEDPDGLMEYRPDRLLVQQWVPDGYKVAFKAGTDGNTADLADLQVFDYVIGNGDRHNGNWMVGPKGEVMAIDHSLAFYEQPGRVGVWDESLSGLRLTSKQTAFLSKVVDAGPDGLGHVFRMAGAPLSNDQITRVYQRAKALVNHGALPTVEEWNRIYGFRTAGEWWGEAVLREHPGHSDQKVHGRRGGRSSSNEEIEDFLRRPVTITGRLNESLQGVNSSFIGEIDGKRVFVKVESLDELEGERAAQALNDAFGPMVDQKRLVWHDPESIDFGSIDPGGVIDDGVLVAEWAEGYKPGFRGYPNQDELRDMAVFDIVIANSDRHKGNYMLDDSGHVLAVDNSRAFWGVSDWNEGLSSTKYALTPKQTQFLQKIVDAGPDGVRKVMGYYRGEEVAGVVERATQLLAKGSLPSRDDLLFGWTAWAEAVLREHPGHADQKVHGRWATGVRGGAVNLNGTVTNLTRLRGHGMHPSFVGEIDGQKVFVKQMGGAERDREVACARLNELGGNLVNIPRIVDRGLDEMETFSATGTPYTIKGTVVTEWVQGQRLCDTDFRSRIGKEALNSIAVFDFVTANSDRHLGNVMVGDSGRLHAIDNGLTFSGRDVYPREYLLPEREISLTQRQRAFAATIAGASDETLLAHGVKPESVSDTRQRAQAIIDMGHVPTFEDWVRYAQGSSRPDRQLAYNWQEALVRQRYDRLRDRLAGQLTSYSISSTMFQMDEGEPT